MTGIIPVGAGCNRLPATPAVAFRPAYQTFASSTGWDAGAHSDLQLSGDVRLTFTVNESIAIVCGLAGASTAPSSDPDRATHAFFVTRVGGVPSIQIRESGGIVAGPWPVSFGDTLDVLRSSSRVIYRRNGAVIYRSRVPSTGAVKVAASLYGPQDSIGGVFFGALDVALQGDGFGSGVVRFAGRGQGLGVTIPARGDGIVRFTGSGFGSSSAAAPEFLSGGDGISIFFGSGSGASSRSQLNTPTAVVAFTGRGRALGLGGLGIGSVGFFTNGFAAPRVLQSVGMVESRGITYGFTGFLAAQAVDQLRLGNAMAFDLSILLEQRLPLVDVPTTVSEADRLIQEELRFADTLTLTYRLLQAEGLRLGETVVGDYSAVTRVVDALVLSGAFATVAEAEALVVSALVLGLRTDALAQALVVEGLGLGADLSSLIEFATAIIERLALAESVTDVGVISVVVAEGLSLADAPTTSAELTNIVRESVRFAIRIAIDSGEYVAWAINTESKHLSSYTQFPINSFAVFGGRVLAASSDGIFALDGDSDAGNPIAARVRFALTRLGTGLHKRMPQAYIGYTATGDMLVKVIVTDEKDGKEAHVYRLKPRRAAAPVTGRAKFGRGLRSVYYAFELENVDGANFELDAIEVHPLVLESRSRGNGQGR